MVPHKLREENRFINRCGCSGCPPRKKRYQLLSVAVREVASIKSVDCRVTGVGSVVLGAPKHTHTRTRTCAHTSKLTHTHTRTQTERGRGRDTGRHADTHIHMHKHTHTSTYTYTGTGTDTDTERHTRACTRKLKHTHTFYS